MRVSVGWRQRLSRALALPPGCGPWFSASVCLGWRNRPDHCRDQARCAKEPHKGPEFDGADAVFACRRAAKLPSDSRLRAAVACMSNKACGVRLARRRGACCGSGVHSVCLRAGARSAAVMFTYRCAAPCARGPRAAQGRPETELRCRSRLRRPVLHSDQRACAYRRASGRRPTPCVACTRRRWDAEGSGNALREAPP